jgi:hypothetical protein
MNGDAKRLRDAQRRLASGVRGPASPGRLPAIGNSGLQQLLRAELQRCAPERPDCDCPGEDKERALAALPAARPPGGWMEQPMRRFGPLRAERASCALEEEPARAVPVRESCGLEEESEELGVAERKAGAAQPHQGAATIVCDGKGGYGVAMNSWAGAACGIEGCVRKHEQSHARDWAKRWPNGCKNKDGTAKKAGSQIPLGGKGYPAFLKASECRAYGVELRCINPLLKNAKGACKTTLKDHKDDTVNQKKKFC